MVLRTITTDIPIVRGARAAAGAEGRHHVEARHHDVRRRDRQRQVDVDGVAARLPQREQLRPHHHDRGSDRVRPRAPATASSRSARSASTPTAGRSRSRTRCARRPDVILIGEVRERETMDYAIAFAETGHLCLATLHANSTNQALDRVINFFPEERRAPAADGPVAQHPRVRRAAADSAPRRPRPRARGRGDAQLAAHLRPRSSRATCPGSRRS